MEYWLAQFHVFLLILLRVSAMLAVAPVFGHRAFLARAKIGLAFMMVREIAMGVVVGFAVLLVFIGVQFAGQLAGLQMGFGIVNVIDPHSSEQVSIIGQFLNLLALLGLLTLNGHHLILSGLVNSFDAVPLGEAVFKEPIIHKIIALSGTVFIIAVKISAPILVALFMVSVAMGILARTVPQMNVFIVGFPVQLAVGTLLLMLTLPLFFILVERLIGLVEHDVFALIDFMG